MAEAEHRGKFRKFMSLRWADRWLVIRAVIWLLVARLWIIAVPFRRLAGRLSGDAGAGRSDPDPKILERISYAVNAAAANVPWRSDCFPQTIAARMLLKRFGYGSVIHLGVERVGDAGLAGHAWLTCGSKVVVGGAELERYTEIHRLEE
jgi:hypothetical protein